MFKKSPQINNRAAKTSAIITFISGVIVIIISNGDIPMPWIAQLIGVLLIAYSIYVVAVYVLREHTYIVEENEREDEKLAYIFKINERKGKREMTVVRVRLDEIQFIRIVDGHNKKEVNLERKDKKRYIYDAQFVPERRLEIDILCDGEAISVLTTYDEELIAFLVSLGVTVK